MATAVCSQCGREVVWRGTRGSTLSAIPCRHCGGRLRGKTAGRRQCSSAGCRLMATGDALCTWCRADKCSVCLGRRRVYVAGPAGGMTTTDCRACAGTGTRERQLAPRR